MIDFPHMSQGKIQSAHAMIFLTGTPFAVYQNANGYFVAEPIGPKEVRAMTPIVARDFIEALAGEVIAGDQRVLTWPHTTLILAMGVALAKMEEGT